MRMNDGACFSDSQNRLPSLEVACWGTRLGVHGPFVDRPYWRVTRDSAYLGDDIWAR